MTFTKHKSCSGNWGIFLTLADTRIQVLGRELCGVPRLPRAVCCACCLCESKVWG